MQSALLRLRSLVPKFRSQDVLPANELKKAFFEATPGWWARFTWGFIAADLLVTSSMTEVTWSKWTRPPSDDEKARGETAAVLRPAWQRAGLAGVHLVFGVGLAAALLIGRSRVVRRLHVHRVPSGAAPAQLFIQGVHNRDAHGTLVPFKHTHISPGRDDSEVILRVDGVRGHWWVALSRARVNGVKVGKLQAREALMSRWGVRKGPSLESGAWVGGPVVKNI
ncbi:hypothetical protein FA95DRAFT_1609099 [Auriscalpium vulgare]|uniref:Uncharacterized protein n=1 Tax=Auriscalpium vulgare TaxID=40419 RepID=A0ACB8RHP0_9AGAM|nr:hypothetical protein FA95DRAFT_1609099 [Auriscalpium vulgare]